MSKQKVGSFSSQEVSELEHESQIIASDRGRLRAVRHSVLRDGRECVWYLRRILGRIRTRVLGWLCSGLHILLRAHLHIVLRRRLVPGLLVGSRQCTTLGLTLDVRRFVSNVLHRGLRWLLQLLRSVLFIVLDVRVLRTKLLDLLNLCVVRTVLQHLLVVHGRLRSLQFMQFVWNVHDVLCTILRMQHVWRYLPVELRLLELLVRSGCNPGFVPTTGSHDLRSTATVVRLRRIARCRPADLRFPSLTGGHGSAGPRDRSAADASRSGSTPSHRAATKLGFR